MNSLAPHVHQAQSPEAVHLSTFQTLSQEIGVNEFGLLPFYYRADIIPLNYDTLTPEQRAHYLNIARAPLIYADGFPTTQEGTVFWERLPNEGHADYWMFEKYLSMASTYGYRSIQILAKILANEYASKQQQVAATQHSNIFTDVEVSQASADLQVASADTIIQAQLDYLRQVYVYYFWAQRATAYDRVGQAAQRKIRASRAMILEDTHYQKLERMTTRLFKRFDTFSDEDLEELTAMDVVKMLKEAIQLQRVTVGLPAAGPAGEHLPGVKDSDASVPIEAHLRHISKSHDTIAQGGHDASAALNDENLASEAQELVIKIMRSKQGQN